jgi:AraC family transcriptional regulator
MSDRDSRAGGKGPYKTLSPYHFCRAFKVAIREPSHRYRMNLQIECAKALLAGLSPRVMDIAAMVEYSSLSSLP